MISVSPAALVLTATPEGHWKDALVPTLSTVPATPLPAHAASTHGAIPALGVRDAELVPDTEAAPDLLGVARRESDEVGVADRDGVSVGVCVAVGGAADALAVAVGETERVGGAETDDPSEGVGVADAVTVSVDERDAVGDAELDAAHTTLRSSLLPVSLWHARGEEGGGRVSEEGGQRAHSAERQPPRTTKMTPADDTATPAGLLNDAARPHPFAKPTAPEPAIVVTPPEVSSAMARTTLPSTTTSRLFGASSAMPDNERNEAALPKGASASAA